MTKSKWMTIVTIIACILIVGLVAGLILQAVKKDKPEANVEPVVLSGTFVDDDGKEMLMSQNYAMPMALTLSDLERNTVAQLTLTATIIPSNATNNRVLWEIVDTYDDGVCTSAEIEPTYYGSPTAVLTITDIFEHTYKIIARSAADETIFDTCYVDYLKDFHWEDLDVLTYGNDLTFGVNEVIPVDYDDDYANGTVSGDLEYGEFAMQLDYELIGDIEEQLGHDFTPIYQPVNENFSSDGIPYFLASPYECFAKGSGIDPYTFNLAFCRAVYFYEGEYPPVHISFTARYSYKGNVVTTERITVDNSYEKLFMEFSLEGLYVPVEDIVINGSDIIINAGDLTAGELTCYFDSSDSKAISTSDKIKVAGKQSNCSATINALDRTVSKYLKMESGTEISFTTSTPMTLTIYVDAADKRIKIDGTNYTTSVTESGDICLIIELEAGTHSITKGDSMGVYALTLAA